ncbi:MAG: glycosyltransferase family 2 protein, partial [Candidatus Hydrogenedentes bacterium]|nr:glycosyltransferase family 2 protein [Candidatus Hydrogenedentota bacterium]
MTAPTPDIDIVIVSFNTRELLRRCLDSINKHAAPVTVHSIVVDNASHDGSADMVAQEFPQTRLVVNSENLGFGAANNRGTTGGEAPLILFLNSDAELTPRALAALAACLEGDANAVIAGPALQNSDGSWQPSLRRFPTWGRNLWLYSGLGARFPGRLRPWDTWLNEVEHRSAKTVDMVSGACFLARRQYMDSVGGFDENLFFYEEELDLSLPARRAGKTVRYCPDAHVI